MYAWPQEKCDPCKIIEENECQSQSKHEEKHIRILKGQQESKIDPKRQSWSIDVQVCDWDIPKSFHIS